MYLTSVLVLGSVYDAVAINAGKVVRMCCVAAVLLLLLYKGAALCRQTAASYVNDYWVFQKDYDNFETLSYEIEGVTFYYPKEGDRVGYESFPSSPAKAEIQFLGQDIGDGFRSVNPER